ncbi:hypothetical protein [Streptomyces sp. ISL-99]|uniref:hypothetical protein n=1 Tax=Streptomyces sp. ISL-99 TaxID=2819193 RepID=UPI0027E516CA|nr:hypothetical protein [Streptomyces sp. ISL-99]
MSAAKPAATTPPPIAATPTGGPAPRPTLRPALVSARRPARRPAAHPLAAAKRLLPHARSRAFPLTLASVVGIAAAAAWATDWLEDRPYFDHTARVPVLALAPLLVTAAVGAGLYSHSEELDRTSYAPGGRGGWRICSRSRFSPPGCSPSPCPATPKSSARPPWSVTSWMRPA